VSALTLKECKRVETYSKQMVNTW